jgi:hypothetical protein
MQSTTVEQRTSYYDQDLLNKWRDGDYSMLLGSNASAYIKQILTMKAKERPGRRFFGEAYAASQVFKDMKYGWYNSYKWLTKEKWITGIGLEAQFEKPFHDALIDFIGTPKLKEIQTEAISYQVRNGGKKPVAPDLWIIDNSGHYHFVEMKLPGDSISDHQIAGMTILKRLLENCSVCLLSLQPKIAT